MKQKCKASYDLSLPQGCFWSDLDSYLSMFLMVLASPT